MELYVCWGTWEIGGHACGRAHRALVDAGYDPKVIRSYGAGVLPDVLNLTPGRRSVKRLTGSTWVPVLVANGSKVVAGSAEIVEWAKKNPARAS